jgi:hypothetical protein
VLLGFAEDVAAVPFLPDGVLLRRVSEAEDLRRIGQLSGSLDDAENNLKAVDNLFSLLVEYLRLREPSQRRRTDPRGPFIVAQDPALVSRLAQTGSRSASFI